MAYFGGRIGWGQQTVPEFTHTKWGPKKATFKVKINEGKIVLTVYLL